MGSILRNIKTIPENNLCTGCGTCIGLCPTNAITLKISEAQGIYYPEIDDKKCTECNLCLKICAGHSVHLNEGSYSISKKIKIDKMIGGYHSCFIGHSNDEKIRKASTSGGIITQILDHALTNGFIDGAIVVRMKKDDPLVPDPFIAKSNEDILSAAKSKYCPVPMNVALREIKHHDGRYAVVGLPCHIHGIRLAENELEWMRNKIVLRIGLFCSHTVNFWGTDFILKQYGINKNKIKEISYRGKGWPGKFSVAFHNSKVRDFPFIRDWYGYWNAFSSYFFTPIRCLSCPDQSNELSDISIGDAWLPELRNKTKGEAVIVSRSNLSDQLLSEMKNKNSISIRKIPVEKVKESQEISLNMKKENLAGRLNILYSIGLKTPKITPLLPSTFLSRIGALLPITSVFISNGKTSRKILYKIPLPIYRLYFGLFRILNLLTKNTDNYRS